ncbi:MAG: tripartite tricarboxylate transporter substrate binding protein [Burkholderiales bacterium]
MPIALRSCLRITIAALAVQTISVGVHAQAYPDKPVHIVVPYAAGGAVDIVARTVGQPLQEALKQPVIVENRPGAGGNIGMEAVARAAPDGYTLLMASNAIATNNALFPKLTFDGRKDFTPVARIGYAPLVIVVPASSPAKSLKDLIAQAKAEPGKLTYATAGNGSSGHLAGELFKSAAKVDVTHVPYKGGAPAITDLVGERISFMPINAVEVMSHIKSGRLRALAVASDRRFPLLPDVPTAAEAGLPGFEATVWWGLVAPAKTPGDVVARLNADTNRILAEPAVVKRFDEMGVVLVPQAPDKFGAYIASQADLWSGVVKAGGIQPE